MSVEQHNMSARGEALRQTGRADSLLPVSVTYESRGRLLLIGPEDRVRRAAALAAPELHLTLAVSEQPSDSQARDLEAIFNATAALESLTVRDAALEGYLGHFSLRVRSQGGESLLLERLCHGPQGHFDLVLDLGLRPLIVLERPPFGYRHLADDEALAEAMGALAGMIGLFDKPRYFTLDSEACAFTARGVPGCSRCLDRCASDAIRVEAGQVRIDPFLCQGLGSCASACPTGAIHYREPEPEVLEDYLWRLLERYRAAGGHHPSLLIVAHETPLALEQLPGHWLPLSVDEVGSVGVESWLLALAAGAGQVCILTTGCGPTVRQSLEQEVAQAQLLLGGAGLPRDAIALWDGESPLPASVARLPLLARPVKGGKRERLFAAFDALRGDAGTDQPIPLPAGAPYGAVVLAEADCTLCMGCVAVCPTGALHSPGDMPALHFTEQSCVQCGLCERACPERVIALAPRLLPDTQARRSARQLKGEEPACCIRCGKPYAPASLVRRIREKLAGHSQFQGAAFDRLLMCEDCRVRDVFEPLVVNPLDQVKV